LNASQKSRVRFRSACFISAFHPFGFRDAATNWDKTLFFESEAASKAFSNLLGNLGGDAAALVRRSVPQIFGTFFKQGSNTAPTTKPIAELLFVLIAMDDAVSSTDLELLAPFAATTSVNTVRPPADAVSVSPATA
jgi:hypothetical protein